VAVAVGADGLGVIGYFGPFGPAPDYWSFLEVAHCVDVACSSASSSTAGAGANAANVSLVVTSDGKPRLQYWGSGGNQFVRCRDVACSSATVIQIDNVVGAGKMTLDAYGLPIVMFTSSASTSSLQVVYERCVDIDCSGLFTPTVRTATDTNGDSTSSALTTGADASPLFVYTTAPQRLAALHCAGSACATGDTPTTVAGGVTGDVSVTVGSDGWPLIAARNVSTHGLQILRCVSPSCAGTTIGAIISPTTGATTAITIGADGLPLVAFVNNGLSVVHCSDIFCTPYARRH
jgi:hypothetical protein